MKLQGKTVVITGANRGIGLALVNAALEQGAAKVFALCRVAGDVLPKKPVTIIDGVDVSEPQSISHLASKIEAPIDVLINNAGIFANETLDQLDYDSIQKQFAVNTLGPLRITEALLPRLSHGSKVALITSRMGSIADNSSGGYYGYRMSKAALNAAGMSLARDLRERGIAVAILHPGFVQTEMVGFAGDISAETAAQRLLARIDGLSLENTGTFWHSSGETLPW